MDRVNDALRRVPTWVVYLAGVAWVALVFWQAVTGSIGVDPVRELEHELGIRALQLLILGLLVTPLRRYVGLNLLRFRRAIGLTAFGFVACHFAAWLVFDIQVDLARAWADVLKRPYITIGMAGFLMLTPLAVTSNNASIKRMGGMAWRKLHKLVYPAVLAGGVHFLWLVKSWPPEPIIYCLIIVALLALRFLPEKRRQRVA